MRHLEGNLSAAQHELKKVDQLTCEIYFDKIKDKITKCGHTFRGECVLLHARSQTDNLADSMTRHNFFPCQCAEFLSGLRTLRISIGGKTFQEVVVFDSDTDSDNEEDDDRREISLRLRKPPGPTRYILDRCG